MKTNQRESITDELWFPSVTPVLPANHHYHFEIVTSTASVHHCTFRQAVKWLEKLEDFELLGMRINDSMMPEFYGEHKHRPQVLHMEALS